MNKKATSTFKDPDVAETPSFIHDKYVDMSVHKAPYHSYLQEDRLMMRLGLDRSKVNNPLVVHQENNYTQHYHQPPSLVPFFILCSCSIYTY